MKILHVIDHWGLGGAQRALTTLVRRETAHRHQIAAVFSHGAHPWPLPPSCPLDFLGSGYGALALTPFRLRRLIRQTMPDVLQVHLNGARFVAAAALAAFRKPPPLVWHEHSAEEILLTFGHWKGKLMARALRLLARRTAGMVANSEHTRSFCHTILGARPDGVVLLHCPVDGEEIRAGAAQPIREKPLAANGGFGEIVGFAGRLVPQKGLSDLLDLAPSLLARRPNCQIWIVGDGPGRLVFERQVRNMGLSGRIVFWGARNDIFSVMNAMSLLVMPSKFEPFGLVAAEAFILGKPVVGYDVDGLSELLAGHALGVAVPPGDRAGLAREIEHVLNHPPKPEASPQSSYEDDSLIEAWSDYYSQIAARYRK